MSLAVARPPRDEFVDFNGIVKAILAGRWIILTLAFIGAVAFGVRAWLATPIYRAEAIVGIADDASGGIRGLMGGQIGALAALAGVDFGGGQNRRSEYIASLSSNSAIRDFISRENLLPELFPRRWNSDTKSWRDGASPPIDDAIDKFRRDVLQIRDDRETGLITVQVEWRDPKLAAKWVDDLIAQVNDQVRRSVIAEAQNSIVFLNKELTQTPTLEMREGIYRLIEANLGRVVVANAQRQYALKIIDPPTSPDPRRHVRPKRVLETILGGVLGGFAGVLIAMWRRRRLWWPSPER